MKDGYVKHRRKKRGSKHCACGSKLGYAQKYDAYFCISSLGWADSKCSDLDCCSCQFRPKKVEKAISITLSDVLEIAKESESLCLDSEDDQEVFKKKLVDKIVEKQYE